MMMGYALLGCLLVSAALYIVLPDLLLHRLGIGSWKRQYGPGVALTIDDGPDPAYTPRILDVLKKHHVCAAFFVVAEKAQKHPELIRRIKEEGHLLGTHSLNHRHAWFTSPWKTRDEWTESVRILERLADTKIVWMRPPWGTFNLMTWRWLKRHKMRAVLWNAEGRDWKARRTPEEITKRILQKTNEGTIIVLHDSGGELGACENAILALDQLCVQIEQSLKLPLVPLEFPEWKAGRRWLFLVWEKWERYYAGKHRLDRIDAANIFRLEKKSYDGPKIYDEDGKLLAEKGDPVAEIHFANIRFQTKERDMQKIAVKAMRQARESLPGLARYVAVNPAYDDVKVFMGQTLLYRAVKGFGFTVQELPSSWQSRGAAWLQRMIMRIYHPAGKGRKNERLGKKPMLVWISREKLRQFDYQE